MAMISETIETDSSTSCPLCRRVSVLWFAHLICFCLKNAHDALRHVVFRRLSPRDRNFSSHLYSFSSTFSTRFLYWRSHTKSSLSSGIDRLQEPRNYRLWRAPLVDSEMFNCGFVWTGWWCKHSLRLDFSKNFETSRRLQIVKAMLAYSELQYIQGLYNVIHDPVYFSANWLHHQQMQYRTLEPKL